MAPHRFRFFLPAPTAVGEVVQLADDDVRHLRVIRAQRGELVELVDSTGVLFAAHLASASTAEVVRRIGDATPDAPAVVLYAGVLNGQRWDTLVDGAVQAGVARIVPLVQSSRERDAFNRRAPRMQRLLTAAAKQAKRTAVPSVDEPIAYTELAVAASPGIVLDTRAVTPLFRVIDALGDRSDPLSLVVGAASGLPIVLVDELQAGGWQVAGLGPTVLRSELAAAIAVSCAVQALAEVDA